MPLTTTSRMIGNVTIIDCAGTITTGEGVSTLRESIIKELELGNKNVLLNLNKVTYIDSCGIAQLFASYNSVVDEAGQLKLLSVHKRLTNLLQNYKLPTVLDLHTDESAAVRSFS